MVYEHVHHLPFIYYYVLTWCSYYQPSTSQHLACMFQLLVTQFSGYTVHGLPAQPDHHRKLWHPENNPFKLSLKHDLHIGSNTLKKTFISTATENCSDYDTIKKLEGQASSRSHLGSSLCSQWHPIHEVYSSWDASDVTRGRRLSNTDEITTNPHTDWHCVCYHANVPLHVRVCTYKSTSRLKMQLHLAVL